MVRTSTIKGSDKAISIGGFRGITVNDVDELLNRLSRATSPAIFQIFDAARIAGWRHLYMAAVNAVGAFESGSPISRGLGIEVLLYASCQDQISRALDVVGVGISDYVLKPFDPAVLREKLAKYCPAEAPLETA